MSTTHTAIGELDRVALINPVECWPVGTERIVALVYPSFKVLEIDGIEESGDDTLGYLPEAEDKDLRLGRRWVPPNPSSERLVRRADTVPAVEETG